MLKSFLSTYSSIFTMKKQGKQKLPTLAFCSVTIDVKHSYVKK